MSMPRTVVLVEDNWYLIRIRKSSVMFFMISVWCLCVSKQP